MNATIRFAESVAKHSAYRTGGSCEVWVVAHDDEAVHTVLSDCKAAGWSVVLMGSGSRVLFRDGAVKHVVLRLGTGFAGLRIEGDELHIGGAVPVGAGLAFAARAGLAASLSLYTAMGTFGASALADDWDLVSVDLGRTGGIKTHLAAKVGARTKGVVVRGVVRLEQIGEQAAVARSLKALKKHPPGAWFEGGRGSVRKTLRQAALDRVRLRNVAILDGAPEMLVNLGGGTAMDLQLLQKSAMERVKRTRGVSLSSTIRWTGRKEAD